PLIHPVRPRARGRLPPRRLHHLVGDPAEEQGIGSFHLSGPGAHRLLVRGGPCPVMAAAVEGDVYRGSKWSHLFALPCCASRVSRTVLRRLPAPFPIGAPIAPTQHRRGANQTADQARTDSAISSTSSPTAA